MAESESVGRRLVAGDVVLRTPDRPPLLFIAHVTKSDFFDMKFYDLEHGVVTLYTYSLFDKLTSNEAWTVLERSHPGTSSGSVDVDHSNPMVAVREEDQLVMKKNLTSKKNNRVRMPSGLPMTSPNNELREANTMPAPAEKPKKAKKTRTVDYTRTDKRPHSFRYKRGSTFVARSGAVSLSKESDGTLVIGTVEGAAPDAVKLENGTLELVQIRKRPNGMQAIAFKHPELGEIVAYDARAARAALRAS